MSLLQPARTTTAAFEVRLLQVARWCIPQSVEGDAWMFLPWRSVQVVQGRAKCQHETNLYGTNQTWGGCVEYILLAHIMLSFRAWIWRQSHVRYLTQAYSTPETLCAWLIGLFSHRCIICDDPQPSTEQVSCFASDFTNAANFSIILQYTTCLQR